MRTKQVTPRGYAWKSNGKIFLKKCPKCILENWAPAVATGQCAWCGYKAMDKDVRKGK